MPVLPSVTLSVGLLGRFARAARRRSRSRSWTRRPGRWSRRSLAGSRGGSGAASWRGAPGGFGSRMRIGRRTRRRVRRPILPAARDVLPYRRPGVRPRRARIGASDAGRAAMFTGLVEALGRVGRVVEEGPGRRLTIAWPGGPGRAGPLALGESIAVNGCCLTVVADADRRANVRRPGGPRDLAPHEPGRPGRGRPGEPGARLRVGDRLGGHFVQGHVDTTAVLRERRPEGDWEFLAFAIDPAWTPLMVAEGLDRRRRREPDPGRRRGRRLLGHAHPAHPGRHHPGRAAARRRG